MQFLSPQFTLQATDVTGNQARFIIEPLPQGFGNTLGNALRRVLYTATPGAALIQVDINQANHQFTTIEGVQEDVVQIVLNLKQVRVRYQGDEPVQISISAKGPGVVKAGDFTVSGSVVIANPDLVIAHLADKSTKLDLTATVASGLGYSPAEERDTNTVGVIPLDASFTPVTRVNFSVEATRVGRVTNFDKLVLDVTTDGTLTPAETLKIASQTLVNYFASIVNPEVSSTDGSSVSGAGSSSQPSLSIEELDLPTRISNALQKAGFESVSQLLSTPRAELSKVKNLGGKSVKIIELALKERGFELTL